MKTYIRILCFLFACTIHVDGKLIAELPPCHHFEDFPHFEYAVRSPYFVDKTMLVKDFFEGHPFLLVTSPNGFGKSTNLDMARRFFQMPFNDTGDEIDRTTTPYYRLFTNTSLNLRIARDRNFVDKYFGKFIVLYFNFGNVQGTTIEQILRSVMNVVKSAIVPYRWLYDKLKRDYEISQNWEIEFDMIYWRKLFDETTKPEDFAWALEQVAETIKDHCILHRMVLIDDYDAPVMRAVNYSVDAAAVNDFMFSIIDIFLNASDGIKPAMVVGVHRPFQNVTSDENMYVIDRRYFLNNRIYGEYFGFNERELDRLLTTNGVDKAELNTLRRYFNGYRFKKNSRDPANEVRLPLYNSEGVQRYLRTKTYDEYLARDHVISKLMNCLRHREFFQFIVRLLAKQTIDLDINLQTSSNDLHKLVDIVRGNCSALPRGTQYMTPFLDSGYLTYDDQSYRIPNKMTEKRLTRELQHFYSRTYDIVILETHLGGGLKTVLYSNITDELLDTFGFWLQHLLTLKLLQNLDEFKFKSIVISALYCDAKSLDEDLELIVFDGIDAFAIFDPHQKVGLVFKTSFHGKTEDTVREIRNYEIFAPANVSGNDSVKYLGINLSEMKTVKVEKA